MSALSRFDLHRIRAETFVRELDFHWEIDSTNTHALQQAESGEPQLPLLVLAERQTQGRGRGVNRWWSSDGSLTFSLMMPLESLPPERIPCLSLTVGLALCRVVEQFSPQADVALKWPNDVYLDGRKLAGILIELPARRPPRAVVGIGINVNNSTRSAPEDLALRCLALCDALGHTLELQEVLVQCLLQIERHWNGLAQDPEATLAQWREYDLLDGAEVEIDVYQSRIQGRAEGIDGDGALLVRSDAGVHRCLGGVIRSFRLPG